MKRDIQHERTEQAKAIVSELMGLADRVMVSDDKEMGNKLMLMLLEILMTKDNDFHLPTLIEDLQFYTFQHSHYYGEAYTTWQKSVFSEFLIEDFKEPPVLDLSAYEENLNITTETVETLINKNNFDTETQSILRYAVKCAEGK